MRRSVILVDIDGTLLSVDGRGRAAFRMALEDVFGTAGSIETVDFSGATDLDVLDRVLRPLGIVPPPDQVDAFFSRLAEKLNASLSRAAIRVFPGVLELLAALSANPRAVVGLLTGNTGRCARIKLEAVRLHGHFVLGAYGHEHADRRSLAALALERARRRMEEGDEVDVWVIGDTPLDVVAARSIGARALGVGTGSFSPAELLAAGADHAVPDLSDTAVILRLMEIE